VAKCFQSVVVVGVGKSVVQKIVQQSTIEIIEEPFREDMPPVKRD